MMRRWDAGLQQQTQVTFAASMKEYAEARAAGTPIQRALVPDVESFPGKVTTHIEPGQTEAL